MEDDRPGGVCLNWGCIPTKALLRNAEVVGLVQRASEFGISVTGVTVDYAQAIQRSRRVADRMAKGVEFLFRKNKVTLFPGVGSLTGRNTVQVKGKDATRTLEAKSVILATGSEPKSLPGVAIDETRVISSNGAVRNEARPGSLIIIGAGAVGMEFADVYATYGTEVTVLEALSRVLPVEDEEASTQIARLFARRGITIRTGVKVETVKAGADGVAVEVDGRGQDGTTARRPGAHGRRALRPDREAWAWRRSASSIERGFVKVSPTMETSVPGIYAIGDMAGNQLLAHKAMAEGVVAAEAIAGRSPRPVDYGNVPSCTYCRPQVASIGFAEAKARADGREVTVGRFPFTANGKAVALGRNRGLPQGGR